MNLTLLCTAMSRVRLRSAQTPVAAFTAIALVASLGLSALPWPVQAQSKSKDPVVLNFVGAEIEAVARTIATITGRNVVLDPRVKGTLNLSTDKPVAPAAALNQFAAALRLQGFTLVDTGGLYKIVPEADAKLQGNPVNAGPVSTLSASNQIVTQIFRLNHENANNLVPVLRPLIGPNNTINVNPGNNSLVITDYADNLQRIGRIIAALDVAGATDVEIIPLQHAIATDIVALVTRLIESGGGAGGAPGDASFKTTLVAEPRSNSLVMRAANPARLALVRALVTKLDQPTSKSAAGDIYVVYLKNADAVSLATTLRAALAGGGGAGGGAAASAAGGRGAPATPGGGAANAATAPVAASAAPSVGGQIQADPATNALIITAPEPQYRQLRAVIDQLDARRAQVYIESLIAEVTSDRIADFGVQWQLGTGTGNLIGLLGTNFSAGGQNIFSSVTSAGNIAPPSPGFNFALGARRNGEPVLGLLARFLQNNSDTNILSTPNLLTLDNEEAKIVIGENVPFVTGSFTNTGGGNNGSVNPFQTIERKDVGLTLRVKPQISENGTVKLTIFQESSKLGANTSAGLSTRKRTIESTVLVDNGAIVVLGGLLEDDFTGSEEKVPGLGDVPFFGNLFKSERRIRAKKNLMVFLRPVVVRDSRETSNLALDRYELMRAIQKDNQPVQRDVLGVNEAPVMPPERAPGASLAPLGAPGISLPVPAPQAAPAPVPAR